MDSNDLYSFVENFGKNISFTLSGGGVLSTYEDGKPLKGIFDNAFYNPQIGEIDLETSLPRLTCVAADVVAVQRLDSCTVQGEGDFWVDHIEPDGTGMAIVILNKDEPVATT